jgi:hypothetical protein
MPLLLLSAFVWVMVSTFRKYGRDGIILKIALFIDALMIFLTLALGRDPFTWPSHQTALWFTPHFVWAAVFFTLSLIAIAFLPESAMHPLMDEIEQRYKWIICPAAVAVVCAVWLYFDPGFFGKAPKPTPPPAVVAPAAPAAAHHPKRKVHPVAFQLENPSVVYASDGSPGTSDDDVSGWVLWPVGIFAGLFFIGSRNRAKARKERNAAQKAAHTFEAPNVHGNAGYASKGDARKKGWI